MSTTGALFPRGADLGPQAPAELGALVARVALGAAWSARHPREPFARRPEGAPVQRAYYRAADGWESPIWRLPPRPGATGEPVVLAHGMGASFESFRLGSDRSLVAALHAAGFDVFLLAHRGDAGSLPPSGARDFDFDDIAENDVPAALARVRALTGFPRAAWIGHSMGGQLLYAHLARGGEVDLCAAVALCAAVRFEAPRTHARLAAAAAALLPSGWNLPLRAVNRALAPLAEPSRWAAFSQDAAGPLVRGLMLYGVEDVGSGLVRQAARWIASGALCDRADRLDYVDAMRGNRLPVLVIAGGGDRICPPPAARPAFDACDPAVSRWVEVDDGFGHVDVLLGARAGEVVVPEVVGWLDAHRRDCWEAAPSPAAVGGG